MIPFPHPRDFLAYIVGLTGDRGAEVEDFSEHDGVWRRLQWEIRFCDQDGPPMKAYRLQITGKHLDSAVNPKEMVLDYLRKGLCAERHL